MNIQIRFSNLLLSCLLLLLGVNLSSCVDSKNEVVEKTSEWVPISLNLSAPGSSLATRAAIDEKAIDASKTQILLFDVMENGDELFKQVVNITKNKGKSLEVLVPRSENGQMYRFVVLTNAEPQTIAKGTPKVTAMNQFQFDCAGKWNASTTSVQSIPMWGEYGSPIVVEHERFLGILLQMALARVDVGLNFKEQTQDNQTEEVLGLPNFKLTSVRVYRTKNKGYVATSSDRINSSNQVVKTNIPSDAIYNLNTGASSDKLSDADASPLLYEVDLSMHPSGVDKVVREIFIPESAISSEQTMDNVPCIVIGGYYGDDKSERKETFYRMDFGDYDADGVTVLDYKSILRNHRYVFNIQEVNNPGFPTEDQALKSLPINLTLDVQDWNEHLLYFQLQGEYYFAFENRKVIVPTVDSSGNGDKPANLKEELKNHVWIKVPYQSNIPKEKWEKTWDSSSTSTSNLFEFIVDDHYFWFGATPNIFIENDTQGKTDREDKLKLQVLDMDLSIEVFQEALNTVYLMDCKNIVVNGKYREGQTLNYTHTMSVTLRSPTELKNLQGQMEPYSLKGMPISVYTETRKGIHFEYHVKEMAGPSETKTILLKDNTPLKVHEYHIELQGYGTPKKDPNDPIKPDSTVPDAYLLPIEDLVVSSNSVRSFGDENVGLQKCLTRVFFGYRTKKILTIGANAIYRYGYVLEHNTGSRAFVDASVNFGIDPNSTVTVEQFTAKDGVPADAIDNAFYIQIMTHGSGMSAYEVDAVQLESKLKVFQPDIILMGYATKFTNKKVHELISDFVNKGGVLIMFTEYYPNSDSVNSFVEAVMGRSLKGSNRALSQSEFRFRLPEKNDSNEKDAILNGPFGDLRGKNWGTDGYALYRFADLQNDKDVTVYNRTKNEEDACFFKFSGMRTDGSKLPKAFVFNGDGGFISNAQRFIGPEYKGMSDYCPFAINSAYQPIARTNFLGNKVEDIPKGTSLKDRPAAELKERENYRDRFVYNSQLFGNILTWAIDYAEFHGINSKK